MGRTQDSLHGALSDIKGLFFAKHDSRCGIRKAPFQHIKLEKQNWMRNKSFYEYKQVTKFLFL